MRSLESRNAQRGAVVVLVAIAMGALILMAGLALDMGHAFLNKTRLQNTVDAAALAAAKELNATGNIDAAAGEAREAFARNASSTGNRELSLAYRGGAGNLSVAVEFSKTLPPFTPGAPRGPYVRVRATGFVMPAWLVRVGGIFEKRVAATAVAGPRTLNPGSTVCNLAPMMVCGTPGGPGMWGYEPNSIVVLKSGPPGGASAVGPGNFQLVRVGGSGARIVRENMAGSYSACLSDADGTSIDTEPGSDTGPVSQGLNTRFGDYKGPVDIGTYPPDVIIHAQSPALTSKANGDRYDVYQGNDKVTPANFESRLYHYGRYQADLAAGNYDYRPLSEGGPGAFGRRILTVPVGNCSGTATGATKVPLLGFACFFLLQPVDPGGPASFVFGQFIDHCTVNGTPGSDPVAGNGPLIIQLYDDPASNDS